MQIRSHESSVSSIKDLTMNHARKNRSQSRNGQSRRRLHHGLQRFRSRRLVLEALELRQMLSAAPIEFTPPGLHSDGDDHDHLPPALTVGKAHYETRWIDGERVTIVADPAFGGPLDDVAPTSAASSALNPLTSIPVLNSNPGAPATIYLDFDGHFEAQWGSFTNITTPVYDIDNDLTTFSDAELNNIYLAWQKAAEDFAPFNINVTTVEPPELAAGVPESAANGVALRVAIGGDNSWWMSGSAGVALMNSFTNSQVNTVYVFPRSISADFIRAQQYIGDLASHEAGHGFGLDHQSSYDSSGNKIAEYYGGNGTWGPLMGYVYAGATITWHNGTSGIGPTVYQDDMAIIAGATNGFGYRTDDHGNTLSSASPLSSSGTDWTGTGLIETNSDVDIFSFTAASADTYRIAVDAAETAPNLDSILELRDAGGALLAAAAPTASLGASISIPLAIGTYFVSVAKIATYGWVGTYSVDVTQPAAGITVDKSGTLVVPERGTTSIGFTLATQPTADATVPLSLSDPAQATLSASSLTFTPADWNVPHTVTVSGTDDEIVDGDVALRILLGAATSADAEYDGLDLADVAAVSTDHAYGGFAYWTDRSSGLIQRAPLNGGPVETLLDGQYSARGLAVDAAGGKVYWTDQAAGQIRRANLDGSNAETILSGYPGGSLIGIELDSLAGKLYWVDPVNQKIQRANLDGSAVQDIVTTQGGLWDLALDTAAGKIYWGTMNDQSIRRANLDGTGVELLWTGDELSRPRALALDLSAGKLYWADSGTREILRANLNGTSPDVVADASSLAPSPLWSMTVDSRDGKIYWTDFYRDTVYRMNLDGSGITAVIDGLNDPQAIAIVEPAVSVTPAAGLLTSESGGAATFQVTLTTPPKANVTIPVSSSNTVEGTVAPTCITFTPANWNVPRTITISGVDDTVLDGNKSYSVVLGPATSADSDFAGVNPRDVSVINVDNEVKFYVVNDASTNVSYRYAADGTPRGNSTLNTGNAAPRGVASTIAGDKTWVIDDKRKVYVYNAASGALLGSWTAGTLANNATPEGITTNGTDVWIVDSKSDKVFRYAGAATRLSGTQTAASSFNLNSGNSSAKDIVTDGASLWVVNDTSTDRVFKYTVSGSLLGSWTIDSANRAPTGITIDPANVSHIWIVDSGTDRVYQYNAAATRTSGSQSATVWFALTAGNTNPQGIADPPAPTAVADVIRPQPDLRNALGVIQETSTPKNRRPERLALVALARDEYFESFSLDRTNAPAKRISKAITSSDQDDARFTDWAGDYFASYLALDSAFASVT
jgi:sugar lactone lactonase YvrE